MSKERWGITISDLHSGSRWGLRQPRVKHPGSGDTTLAGPVAQTLWKEWAKRVRRYSSPDFVIFGGDGVEGAQRKDGSKWLWTANVMEQADAAIPYINSLNAGAVYGVQGTKYHVEEGGLNADEYIMKHVTNAVDTAGGRFAPPDRYIHVHGAVIHVSHKIGGTSVFQYRGTPLSRELAMNRVMSYSTEVHKANLILRGHVHHYFEVRAGVNSRCAVMPCFKARDDYAGLMHPFTWMPHLGVLVIIIKDGKVRWCEPDTFEFPQQRPELEDLDAALARFGRLKGVRGRPPMPLEFPEWLQTVAPDAAAV